MRVGPDVLQSITENRYELSGCWLWASEDIYTADYREILQQPTSLEATTIDQCRFKADEVVLVARSGPAPDAPVVFACTAYLLGDTDGIPTTATDHASLSGLLGTGPEYVHLNAAQQTGLTAGGDTTLHHHSADRARANHTGTQLATTISDFGPATISATAGVYQPISAELSALAGLSSTGYAKHTGAGAWSVVASIPQADVSGLTAALATIPLASATTPLMDGTAAVGTWTTWARADHVHPSDTSKLGVRAQAYDSARLGGMVAASYALASSVPVASSTTPSALGTAAVGIGTTWARADHVHAMPTAAQVGALGLTAQAADSAKLSGQPASYYATVASLGSYLLLAGGIMSGKITSAPVDLISTTSANTLYSSAVGIELRRASSSGTGTNAGIGFHNIGVNAAALFYSSADSEFWFNRHTGDLVKLWHSGNFIPGNYLPLSGGTLTGLLNADGGLVIPTAQASYHQGSAVAHFGGATWVDTSYAIRNAGKTFLGDLLSGTSASFSSTVTATGYYFPSINGYVGSAVQSGFVGNQFNVTCLRQNSSSDIWTGLSNERKPGIVYRVRTDGGAYSNDYQGWIFSSSARDQATISVGNGTSAWNAKIAMSFANGITLYGDTTIVADNGLGTLTSNYVSAVNGLSNGAVLTVPAASTITLSTPVAGRIRAITTTAVDQTAYVTYGSSSVTVQFVPWVGNSVATAGSSPVSATGTNSWNLGGVSGTGGYAPRAIIEYCISSTKVLFICG